MLKTGILNPYLNSLLSRVRHTNSLVIADRGFPYWPKLEIVDLALVDDVPTVLQVLQAIQPNFVIASVFMAQEFRDHNSAATQARFAAVLGSLTVTYEPHLQFKMRVPEAIGLIRTADTVPYANMILVSG